VKAVAETLGVARSNLVDGLRRPERRRRGPYRRARDHELLAEIRAITDGRPTYGYRRITALLNRARRASGSSRRVTSTAIPVSPNRAPKTGNHARSGGSFTCESATRALGISRRPLGHLRRYDAAVDASCRAWNALTAERIRSPASYLEQVRV
jgi:hypothetical protein